MRGDGTCLDRPTAGHRVPGSAHQCPRRHSDRWEQPDGLNGRGNRRAHAGQTPGRDGDHTSSPPEATHPTAGPTRQPLNERCNEPARLHHTVGPARSTRSSVLVRDAQHTPLFFLRSPRHGARGGSRSRNPQRPHADSLRCRQARAPDHHSSFTVARMEAAMRGSTHSGDSTAPLHVGSRRRRISFT